MKKYSLPSPILEKYRSELVDLVFKKARWLREVYGVNSIVTHELIDMKCSKEWSNSLEGTAKAAEYICNLCIENGDVTVDLSQRAVPRN